MRKVLVISGPTASGKTDLAYSIALDTQSVLLNADSRQVYQQLDIISGKDLPKDARFIEDPVLQHVLPGLHAGYYKVTHTKVYLLDLVRPDQIFNVNEFVYAVKCVLSTLPQDIIPIIVGGSNFYIRALTDGIETIDIPPNEKLRLALKDLSIPVLQKMLWQLSTEKYMVMNESDMHNRVRLVRAIEVEEYKKDIDVVVKPPVLQNYDVLHVGLFAPLDFLRQKIAVRLDERLTAGALEEAKKLYEHYDSLSHGVKSANGYKQLFEYFNGDTSLEQAIEKWKISEFHNAKKQLTWLRGDASIEKFDITERNYKEQILRRIEEWSGE